MANLDQFLDKQKTKAIINIAKNILNEINKNLKFIFKLQNRAVATICHDGFLIRQ